MKGHTRGGFGLFFVPHFINWWGTTHAPRICKRAMDMRADGNWTHAHATRLLVKHKFSHSHHTHAHARHTNGESQSSRADRTHARAAFQQRIRRERSSERRVYAERAAAAANSTTTTNTTSLIYARIYCLLHTGMSISQLFGGPNSDSAIWTANTYIHKYVLCVYIATRSRWIDICCVACAPNRYRWRRRRRKFVSENHENARESRATNYIYRAKC